jgi:hypothetical protein
MLVPLLALAAACGGDKGPAGVIPREKFVAVNVALRSLPDSATPAARAATLRKHGVTEQQLKAWVNGHAREPQEMAKAWEEIAFKLDSAGTTPPMPPATGPTPGVPPSRPRPLGTQGGRVAPPPPSTDARPAIVKVQ